MRARDQLETITTFLVTIALLLMAFLLVREAIQMAAESDRVSPETVVAAITGIANTIVIAAVARWLQQGAAQSAEKAAEKLQEAVTTAATNGGTAKER